MQPTHLAQLWPDMAFSSILQAEGGLQPGGPDVLYQLRHLCLQHISTESLLSPPLFGALVHQLVGSSFFKVRRARRHQGDYQSGVYSSE